MTDTIMTDTIMQQAFLNALEQRTRTSAAQSKTVLPTGTVRNDELTQVLRALNAANDAQSEE